MTLFDTIGDRPLTDPQLVREVVGEVPAPLPGQVEAGFLLCDLNGHLISPLLLSLDELPADPSDRHALLDAVVGPLAGAGAVAAFLVRCGPVHATADDRDWQEAVQRYCAAAEVRDLGFYLRGSWGAAELPHLELVT